MLSFEEKKAVFRSFKLKEKIISNGRINFIYPKSKQKGHVLATQLHPSGNGYVIGKYMDEETIKNNGYKVDPRGWISIRDFSKDELTQVISEAMESMSGKNISVEKSEIRQKKEKAIAITELPEKVHISTEKNVISKKPAVSKKEPVPVAQASEDEKIASKDGLLVPKNICLATESYRFLYALRETKSLAALCLPVTSFPISGLTTKGSF